MGLLISSRDGLTPGGAWNSGSRSAGPVLMTNPQISNPKRNLQ